MESLCSCNTEKSAPRASTDSAPRSGANTTDANDLELLATFMQGSRLESIVNNRL